jgi:hypothetical protein
LASHPSVLRQGLRAQFKYLIITPFRCMAAVGKLDEAVIVLDSLDQCMDVAFQYELIQLIVSQSWISTHAHVRWIVTTRWESRIRPLMSDVDWPIADRVDFELVTDTMRDEGVGRTLKQGFADIRRIFAHQLATDRNWPPSQFVDAISAAAMENLDLASFILHFVADKRANDPRGRLEKCLEWIQACANPRSKDPLYTLDFLYHQLLSEIPPSELHTTLLVVGLRILYPMLSDFGDLDILGLDKRTFYRLFKGLHPLIYVSRSRAEVSYHIRHNSFKEFLLDIRRSGALCLHDGQIHYSFATWALQMLSKPHMEGLDFLSINCQL